MAGYLAWLEPAVERRLSKISRCLAQDLVGLPQLPVLPFQLLDPQMFLAGAPRAKPTIAFSTPHP